ncbi:MAG TPA: FAD-binding protein, partial [Trebonia sp.]|nr:FAD-binding protein [Trebonia sp.]
MRFFGGKSAKAQLAKQGAGVPAGRAPDWARREWDVVVAGGGNAALVAALTANDHGATVLLLERAPRHLRGGNTRHTRDIRCAHGEGPYTTGVYSLEESWDDLCKVGEGVNNEELAMFTVREAMSVPDWMSAHGVLWQPPLSGTLHLGRTNLFFLGGGKALVNAYYREAERRPGVTVAYDAKLEDFEVDGVTCTAVTVRLGGALHRVRTKAVVCACGGFEANIEWLRRYWGDAVDNYIIRGTPYNDGHVLA